VLAATQAVGTSVQAVGTSALRPEHCQAANPNGIFVTASIHVDNSRMPGGDANHFFRSLFNYVSTATAAQMALDNLQWILAWTWKARVPRGQRFPRLGIGG